MAQGSTKKSRNKRMAYTHQNAAMTSAPNKVHVKVSSALVMAAF